MDCHLSTFSGVMLLNCARMRAAPRASRPVNWFSLMAAPTRKHPLKASFKGCAAGEATSLALQVLSSAKRPARQMAGPIHLEGGSLSPRPSPPGEGGPSAGSDCRYTLVSASAVGKSTESRLGAELTLSWGR